MRESEIARDALERELRDATERLEALKAEQRRWEMIIAGLTQLLEAKFGNVSSAASSSLFGHLPPLSDKRLAGLSIREAIRVVLGEKNEPMPVREIMHELEAGGKRIHGRAKAETVRAVLYRSPEFRKTEERKWIIHGSQVGES